MQQMACSACPASRVGEERGGSVAMLSSWAQLLSWGILGTSELALELLLLLLWTWVCDVTGICVTGTGQFCPTAGTGIAVEAPWGGEIRENPLTAPSMQLVPCMDCEAEELKTANGAALGKALQQKPEGAEAVAADPMSSQEAAHA